MPTPIPISTFFLSSPLSVLGRPEVRGDGDATAIDVRVLKGEGEVDVEFDVLPRIWGIVTTVWLLLAEQQLIVSPQHHSSEVLVPSHGVSWTGSAGFD